MKKLIDAFNWVIRYWTVIYPISKYITKHIKGGLDDKALELINKTINKGLDLNGIEKSVKEDVAKYVDAKAKSLRNVEMSYDPKTEKVKLGYIHNNIKAEINGSEISFGLKL